MRKLLRSVQKHAQEIKVGVGTAVAALPFTIANVAGAEETKNVGSLWTTEVQSGITTSFSEIVDMIVDGAVIIVPAAVTGVVVFAGIKAILKLVNAALSKIA